MKNLTKIVISLMIISGTVFNVTGQTLKERIDQAKVVKVYFENFPVRHNPNTQSSEPNSSGTGCKTFGETTKLPAEYINAEKQVIDLLNKGFNTTAFVEGNIETVPIGYYLPEPKPNYLAFVDSYFHEANSLLDWLKLGEPLAFYIYAGGTYNVRNKAFSDVNKREIVNSLTLYSSLTAYCIVERKNKSVAICAYKNLAEIKSPNLASNYCDDYAYFVKYFPLASFAEAFTASIKAKTNDFIVKEMSNYEKAMNKKK